MIFAEILVFAEKEPVQYDGKSCARLILHFHVYVGSLGVFEIKRPSCVLEVRRPRIRTLMFSLSPLTPERGHRYG